MRLCDEPKDEPEDKEAPPDRLPYEKPKILKKRSLARVTNFSIGGGLTVDGHPMPFEEID